MKDFAAEFWEAFKRDILEMPVMSIFILSGAFTLATVAIMFCVASIFGGAE